jgi:hypothetical protein
LTALSRENAEGLKKTTPQALKLSRLKAEHGPGSDAAHFNARLTVPGLALVTTFMTTPLLARVYPTQQRWQELAPARTEKAA